MFFVKVKYEGLLENIIKYWSGIIFHGTAMILKLKWKENIYRVFRNVFSEWICHHRNKVDFPIFVLHDFFYH